MRKKKEKITYVDDGRTIADMSNVSGGTKIPQRPAGMPRASLKEQLGTFWDAMKMMFRPTLMVVAGIFVIYIIIYIIFSLNY